MQTSSHGGLTYAHNMLVYEKPHGPNANCCGSNANPHRPNANPPRPNARPNTNDEIWSRKVTFVLGISISCSLFPFSQLCHPLRTHSGGIYALIICPRGIDPGLKPIFHCKAKPLALGSSVSLVPQRDDFALPIPTCWYPETLVDPT